MARIIQWIKAIFPSDVLDDGPQLVVSVGVGALFGAWVTAKGTGQQIDWLWGWPLLFSALVVVGVVLWIVRGKFTDRVKKSKAESDSARDAKIDEMHATMSEMKQLMTQTPQIASGVAETATGYVNPFGVISRGVSDKSLNTDVATTGSPLHPDLMRKLSKKRWTKGIME